LESAWTKAEGWDRVYEEDWDLESALQDAYDQQLAQLTSSLEDRILDATSIQELNHIVEDAKGLDLTGLSRASLNAAYQKTDKRLASNSDSQGSPAPKAQNG
jgi:hypothetical protein